jgi:hypothetical protein
LAAELINPKSDPYEATAIGRLKRAPDAEGGSGHPLARVDGDTAQQPSHRRNAKMSKAGKGAGNDKPASTPDKLAKAGVKANVELSETELRKTAGGATGDHFPKQT